MPRRESFRSKDGRNYTLWADIDDVVESVLMPTGWGESRQARRERGTIWRGHSNAQWDLIPTLYRPPGSDGDIARRRAYTASFIDALQQHGQRLGFVQATAEQYFAVAQHYGFFTSLLDFSWNPEVAAYFATRDAVDGVGVIYSIYVEEYQKLRNPFGPFGGDIQTTNRLLRKHGQEPLPELQLIELEESPRILAQEGVFIDMTPESVDTLTSTTIDRYYFRQRPGYVYGGGAPHSLHLLADRDVFADDEAYDAFIERARRQRPQLFDRTPAFRSETLFPPNDPLTDFAEAWKNEHRWEPSARDGRVTVAVKRAPRAAVLAAQVDRFYRSDLASSPYSEEYLLPGRNLLESLTEAPELDDPTAQRWLLWELLHAHLKHGQRITVKVSTDDIWSGSANGDFGIVLVDRWLNRSFRHTFAHEDLLKSFVQASFGMLGPKGRAAPDILTVGLVSPPLYSYERTSLSNPHEAGEVPRIRETIESRLRSLDEGIVGSFLYDLHHVILLSTGRALDVTAGIVASAPCFQQSPLTRPNHVRGPALLLRVADRFTGGVTHTAVCESHWHALSEGETDVLKPYPWIVLGLA
jgi:hypothetical protein